MHRTLPLAIAAFSMGCLSRPLTAPEPRSFHVARSATEATQVATLALVNDGFRVTQTDSAGMAIEATRTATHNGNENFVTCLLPKQSAAAANRETTLLISFRAAPGAQGSDITIGSKVNTSYPGYANTTMEKMPNETDCVSNGTMERRLEAVLR